jgi:hypothetical protein
VLDAPGRINQLTAMSPMTMKLQFLVWTALFLVASVAISAPPPRVTAKVEQSQKVKIEGGDFDDKLQRIAFDITITNQSLSQPCEGLSLEFYMVGQAVTQPSRLTLLQKEKRDFSLEARGVFTTQTPEVQLKWDTTGAAFGDKYRGWVLRVLDSEGNQVLQQSSSAFLSNTVNLAGMSVGDSFDKQGKPMGAARQ